MDGQPTGDDNVTDETYRFEIDEPPFEVEDTRPLKPLKVPRDKRPMPPPPMEEEPPPAAVLQEAPPRRTPPPPPSAMDETDRVRLVPRAPEPIAWRLILQTAEPHQSRIGLNVWQSLVIGRLDPYAEDNPDLDLAPHQAAELGVSRQHAVLIPAANGLFLSDLESTNGTWVNGEYLGPGQRYRLQPGDKVELGLMEMVVKTVTPLRRASDG
jgi:hypothetical protein